jgi:hypothetical protein
MELLEKDDPLKNHLLMKSAKHREELENDMKMISERTQKVLTNALIIGGALAATYFVVRQFSGSKKKSKGRTKKIKFVGASAEPRHEEVVEASSPGIVSQIGTALASQATVFLLSIAKDKLTDFVKSQFEKKDETK